MLRFHPLELVQRFRRPGGHDFTLFVNDLIGAICLEGGISPSEISTCSRADARDGGVDTRVGLGSPADKTGYVIDPTIWQFRAADEANVSEGDLQDEVNKPHAKACIEQGHGYRFCVCAQISDEKKTRWLNALKDEIAKINPGAADPKILSVDDLAVLANRYPALVMRFQPSLSQACMSFDSLAASQAALTPVFVPTAGFEARRLAILAHVDLQGRVPEPVLSFQGEAGVGKTRTVYEALRSLPQAPSLVLYTDDEDSAVDVARRLSNDETAHAILLADECTVAARHRLASILRGCTDRVRAVAIDNSGEKSSSVAPELVLTRLSLDEVEKVLRQNFTAIPQDRLRAYAHLSQGVIQLAADMCRYDPQIAAVGSIRPVMASIHDYYICRLGADQRKAVEAIALLRRVGHKDEIAAQLDALCSLTNLERSFVEAQVDSVREVPGFIERGARYYRVTPEIIAMVAFEGAWKRWAEGREESFLQRMPESIQESFLQRVSESASPEVRKTVQAFFRRFADNVSPGDLADIDLVNRFVILIETEPAVYLPMLRRIVESASHDQLVSPVQWTGSGWGPRRQLVWLAERFAQFPEFFQDAEAILYKLASHECEDSIGNNATATWQQLFRMQLSGTALPLNARLAILRRRLLTVDDQSAEPIAGALKRILDFMGSRMLGPPVVAGRIPPPEWHPRTLEEQNHAIREALVLLKDAARIPNPKVSKAATEAILGDIVFLVHRGLLDQVQQVFASDDLAETTRALLVSELGERIAHDTKGPTKVHNTYMDRLEAWLRELEPTSLHGKLVEMVGPDPWRHYGREDEWKVSLQALADALFNDEEAFQGELEWLLSAEAKAAFEFGHHFGTIDIHAKYLKEILQKALAADHVAFPRGYVAGLVYGAKSSVGVLNEELDRLEALAPTLAFQLAHAGGDALHVFDRTVSLINQGKLPATCLSNFAVWVGDRKIRKEEVIAALRLLLPLAKGGDSICSDVMIDFLGYQQNSGTVSEFLSSEPERSLVWEVLTVAVEHPGREAHWWSRVLIAAAPTNQALAMRLACRAATGDNFQYNDEALKVVSELGATYPDEVMNEFGALMLSDSTGWKFFFRKYPIFAALPFQTVKSWLERHGVEAARKIARHLPGPHLDSDGNAVLHPLTEFVLSRFEEDDRTFREFCAGVHSLQMYVGSYASQREGEAKVAQAFFDHPLRRVREWARSEHDHALREAQQDREREDEMGL